MQKMAYQDVSLIKSIYKWVVIIYKKGWVWWTEVPY